MFSRDRVAGLLASDRYAASLGIGLAEVGSEHVDVAVTVTDDHLNFLGVLHGALVFSLADCAFSLASNAAGARAVAIDTHLALTATAAVGDTLTARAVEETRGRTLGVYRVTVTRGDGRTVGLFRGTVHISD